MGYKKKYLFFIFILIIVFIFGLLFLHQLQDINFFGLKWLTSDHKKAEKLRRPDLEEKGKQDWQVWQTILDSEATKTANLTAFSQAETCYIVPQNQGEAGIVYQDKKADLLTIEYEGRLNRITQVNKDGCNLFQADFVSQSPFTLYLPYDFFMERKGAQVNAAYLNEYIGRRIRLSFDYQIQTEGIKLIKWNFTRLYVE